MSKKNKPTYDQIRAYVLLMIRKVGLIHLISGYQDAYTHGDKYAEKPHKILLKMFKNEKPTPGEYILLYKAFKKSIKRGM